MNISRFMWILVILTVLGSVQALEPFTTFTAFGAATFAGEKFNDFSANPNFYVKSILANLESLKIAILTIFIGCET